MMEKVPDVRLLLILHYREGSSSHKNQVIAEEPWDRCSPNTRSLILLRVCAHVATFSDSCLQEVPVFVCLIVWSPRSVRPLCRLCFPTSSLITGYQGRSEVTFQHQKDLRTHYRQPPCPNDSPGNERAAAADVSGSMGNICL